MCRLFAYVHSGSTLSMRETLGGPLLAEFQQLADVHKDGWGTAWRQAQALSLYLSLTPASKDRALFAALTDLPLGSAVIHQRWASPGIGLSLDNQQPFASDGLAFAHNGTIGNEEGNIVQRKAPYRESLGLAGSTTQSDSRIYADLFFLRLAELRRQSGSPEPGVEEVRKALAQTIALLRRDYPEASYNNLIQTPGFTVATEAHADRPKTSEGLRRRYAEAGWSHWTDSYFELGYTTLTHPDGSVTSAAASSGFPSRDRWTALGNNSLLVLSHRDASVRTLPLGLG